MITLVNSDVSIAVKQAKLKLYTYGKVVQSSQWQSTSAPSDMFELFDFTFITDIPKPRWNIVETIGTNFSDGRNFLDEIAFLCKAQSDWAVEHLFERVGGKPLNPGETFKLWKFYKSKPENDKFRVEDLFSHTYMERFWPRLADRLGDFVDINKNLPNEGIRFEYGSLEDIITLLASSPDTRQAYLPVWFPEDTGLAIRQPGQRVPCTLGYLFNIRDGYLHCTYYIRSCDALRHFNDDVFLAMGLTYYILYHVEMFLQKDLKPGRLKMVIDSFHCFNGEQEMLKVSK